MPRRSSPSLPFLSGAGATPDMRMRKPERVCTSGERFRARDSCFLDTTIYSVWTWMLLPCASLCLGVGGNEEQDSPPHKSQQVNQPNQLPKNPNPTHSHLSSAVRLVSPTFVQACALTLGVHAKSLRHFSRVCGIVRLSLGFASFSPLFFSLVLSVVSFP